FEVLGKSQLLEPIHFEILAAQRKYAEGFALVDKARTANSANLPNLEILQARTLAQLGEKEKARAVFARCAQHLNPIGPFKHGLTGADPRAAESEVGFQEDAFEHALRLAAAPGRLDPNIKLLETIYPEQKEIIRPLYSLVRKLFPGDDLLAEMKRLRPLLDGR